MSKTLPPLVIGQHCVRYPIVQGAMAVRVSGARLAGAVANAGGVGVISSFGIGFHSPYFDAEQRRGNFFAANQLALIDELRLAREISPDGVIGVNILLATRDSLKQARTAAQHGANLIITAAGLPLSLPEVLADCPDVAIAPMVCGLDAVKTLCETWHQRYGRLPDALIVENSSVVGGHIGTSCDALSPAIESLLPDIKTYLHTQFRANIPLIAAGGIWTRADVDRMLALGATGVQVGTRFIPTVECDADVRYKEFHLSARAADNVIVPSPVGKPARALRNEFSEQIHAASVNQSTQSERRCVANCLETCSYRDSQKTYCILQALSKAARGDVNKGLIFSGSHDGQATEIQPVAAVMAELTCAS